MRILTTFAVADTISRNGYYTEATDEDFQDMYSFVIEHMEGFTPELFRELARNIKAHSTTADSEDQIADRISRRAIVINR